MRRFFKLLICSVFVLLMNACNILDALLGPFTLDAPTSCLVNGVRYESSQEAVPRAYWPPTGFGLGDDFFYMEYQRDLKSSSSEVTLLIVMKSEESFQLSKEYPVEGSIYTDQKKYTITEGWGKFLDYRGNGSSTSRSYLSGVFEFSASSEDGDIVHVEEGTFDELPVEIVILNQMPGV